MTSPWLLVTLLMVPGLFGLAILMNWLEVRFTYQLVADAVAAAWRSSDSADELEQEVSRLAQKVIVDTRFTGRHA